MPNVTTAIPGSSANWKGSSSRAICARKKNDEKTQQWKILDIMEDGKVDVAAVKSDGSIDAKSLKISLDTFLVGYKECKQVTFLKNYPQVDAEKSKVMRDLEYKSMVIMALRSLTRKFRAAEARIMITPCRGVYACKLYKSGEYVAVPTTKGVIIEWKSEATLPPRSLEGEFRASDPTPRFFLSPEPPGKEFACQAWCIRECNDEKKCNCKLETKVLSMRSPCLSAGVGVRNSNEMIEIRIECIVNFKDIGADDEVVVYRRQVKREEKPKAHVPPCIDTPKPKIPKIAKTST